MTNVVDITPKSSYTVPSNGILVYAAMDTGTAIESMSNVYMQINNTKYNEFISTKSSSGYYQGMMIKNVKKNDTIYCNNTGLEGYKICFIPFSL